MEVNVSLFSINRFGGCLLIVTREPRKFITPIGLETYLF